MEKVLKTSLRPHHARTGIHDPVKEQKLILTKCCSVALQLSSLTGKLGSYKGDQSTRSPGREEPKVDIGTGVYFQSSYLSPGLDSNCDIREQLQNLCKLATVACEASESSIKHCQLVKKRRTPRKVLCINASRSPAAGASDAVKRQRTGNLTAPGHYTQPSWPPEESVQDTSAFNSRLNCTNIRRTTSNTVILKFVSQHGTVGKKIMACPPKSSQVKFKGNNRLSSAVAKCRAPRMPGKHTRIEGVAKRILQFVGDGSTEEKFIRQAFGNNPDTSKALRVLLTQHKVYRIGDGGRGKAFLYVATPAGLRDVELKNHDVIAPDNSAKSHRPNHYEDGLQTSLKDIVSPFQQAHDGLHAPRYIFRDVTNCLPEANISRNVLHAVLGKNKE